MKEQDVVKMNVRFPKEVHEQLRVKAFNERKSINGIIIDSVRQYLKADYFSGSGTTSISNENQDQEPQESD